MSKVSCASSGECRKARLCEWARLNGRQIFRGKQDESVAVIS